MQSTWVICFALFSYIDPGNVADFIATQHHPDIYLSLASHFCDDTIPHDTMAKSLRSKTKLAARRRKAHESHYAVADAERTARISARIMAKAKPEEDAEGDAAMAAEGDEQMKEGEFVQRVGSGCEMGCAADWGVRRGEA